jgi:hypothetical protein
VKITKEVMVMTTPPSGIFSPGPGVLELAVTTAACDTWRLRRKTQKATGRRDCLREAA